MSNREHPATAESIAAPNWQPSAIEPEFDPEQPHRVFLHFPDVPEDETSNFAMYANSKYFTQFAFTLWNAGQTGSSYLTKLTDIKHHGIWLHADPSSPANLAEQVSVLIRQYDKARDPDDDFTESRVAYVTEKTRQWLARMGEVALKGA